MLLALTITTASIVYLVGGLTTGLVSALSFAGDGSNNSYYRWVDDLARRSKIHTSIAVGLIVLLWPIHATLAWSFKP